MMRPFYILAGGLSLALGGVGVVMPLLPTTPFVLLGAACFAKGSPRLHGWLERHALFGPIISNWQREGAIAPRAKSIAVVTMAATLLVSILLQAPPLVVWIQIPVLAAAALFVVTRPSASPEIPRHDCPTIEAD